MSNSTFKDELKRRTKRFALDVLELTETLVLGRQTATLAHQLVRSASSVGANYRSACRAQSVADFIAKLSIVEEEADEALYWLELLEESGRSSSDELKRLKDEASQLIAMIVASKKTARSTMVPRNSKFEIRNFR